MPSELIKPVDPRDPGAFIEYENTPEGRARLLLVIEESYKAFGFNQTLNPPQQQANAEQAV